MCESLCEPTCGCVSLCIIVSTYMYAHVCTYNALYAFPYVCTPCIFVSMYECIHIRIPACVCMYMYVCMRSYPQDPANTIHILRLQNCKDECDKECGLVEVGKSGNKNVKEKNAKKKCRPTVRELNTVTL